MLDAVVLRARGDAGLHRHGTGKGGNCETQMTEPVQTPMQIPRAEIQAARKELAVELLYSGNDEPGSAAWNIWLHKQVMRSIAANGGTLPPDLRD